MSVIRENMQRASKSMSRLALSLAEINRLQAETAELIRTIDECGLKTNRIEFDAECVQAQMSALHQHGS